MLRQPVSYCLWSRVFLIHVTGSNVSVIPKVDWGFSVLYPVVLTALLEGNLFYFQNLNFIFLKISGFCNENDEKKVIVYRLRYVPQVLESVPIWLLSSRREVEFPILSWVEVSGNWDFQVSGLFFLHKSEEDTREIVLFRCLVLRPSWVYVGALFSWLVEPSLPTINKRTRRKDGVRVDTGNTGKLFKCETTIHIPTTYWLYCSPFSSTSDKRGKYGWSYVLTRRFRFPY